jgi:hypothetical protein
VPGDFSSGSWRALKQQTQQQPHGGMGGGMGGMMNN